MMTVPEFCNLHQTKQISTTLSKEHSEMYELLKMVAIFGLDATLKEDITTLLKQIKQRSNK